MKCNCGLGFSIFFLNKIKHRVGVGVVNKKKTFMQPDIVQSYSV